MEVQSELVGYRLCSALLSGKELICADIVDTATAEGRGTRDGHPLPPTLLMPDIQKSQPLPS